MRVEGVVRVVWLLLTPAASSLAFARIASASAARASAAAALAEEALACVEGTQGKGEGWGERGGVERVEEGKGWWVEGGGAWRVGCLAWGAYLPLGRLRLGH